jgi:hypothetical protein
LLYLTKSSCDALSLVGTQLIGDIGYINYILSPTVINIQSTGSLPKRKFGGSQVRH